MSTSYWPVVWSAFEPANLIVYSDSSSLVLPVRPIGVDHGEASPSFAEPEGAPRLEASQLEAGEQDWRVSRNMVDNSGALEVVKDLGVVHFPGIDLTVRRSANERYRFVGNDFSSVQGETVWEMGFSRDDWQTHARTRTVLTSTPTHFHVYAEQDAWLGVERVHSQTWSRSIPRDHL